MLYCGIVGLALSGKSTIFNVITRAGADVKPYAGGKTDPNRAVVPVPDVRFDRLVEVHKPKKETPAQVEFVDLAGLSRDASKGAGLGNGFLSFAAEADALIQVIRGFDNGAVEHPEGSLDAYRDWQIVEMELIFRDLSVIENRLGRLNGKKKLTPEEEKEKPFLARCQAHLMEERPLRDMEMTLEEARMVRGYTFLSQKPQILIVNIDENKRGIGDVPGGEKLAAAAHDAGVRLITLYGRLEMDLLELSAEEAAEFTEGLDMSGPGREVLIAEAYVLLGLMSFFTCGPDEVRAWTLCVGQNAVDAAGAIHTDLARGFIRAQVVGYGDYEKHGFSIPQCRDAGCLRLEGKEYPVKDGDIIEIRFNV